MPPSKFNPGEIGGGQLFNLLSLIIEISFRPTDEDFRLKLVFVYAKDFLERVQNHFGIALGVGPNDSSERIVSGFEHSAKDQTWRHIGVVQGELGTSFELADSFHQCGDAPSALGKRKPECWLSMDVNF